MPSHLHISADRFWSIGIYTEKNPPEWEWLILPTLPSQHPAVGGEGKPYLGAALVEGVADGIHVVVPHTAAGVGVHQEGPVCFTVRVSHHHQQREHGNRSREYMISHCRGTSRW